MLSLASFAVKRADRPYTASLAPEHATFNEAQKAEALRKLLRIGLMGLGTGSGLGLLTGLLSRSRLPAIEDPDVDLPYPAVTEKRSFDKWDLLPAVLAPLVSTGVGSAYGATRMPDDRSRGALAGGLRGAAEGLGTGAGLFYGGLHGDLMGTRLAERLGVPDMDAGPWMGRASWISRNLGRLLGAYAGREAGHAAVRGLGGPPPWEKQSDWADQVAHHVMPTTAGEPAPMVGAPRWWRGDTMTNPWSMPWAIPGAMGVGMAGVAGGHALVRHLLKKRRKASLDAEVEAAKREYEEAMLGQYDPEKVHKLAAANRLDQVRAALEKAADFQDTLGYGGGAYALLAAILGGTTALGTYRFLKGRSQSKMLADALKQRALARQAAAPPNVYLHPVQAHAVGGLLPEEEDEEPEEAPLGLSGR